MYVSVLGTYNLPIDRSKWRLQGASRGSLEKKASDTDIENRDRKSGERIKAGRKPLKSLPFLLVLYRV